MKLTTNFLSSFDTLPIAAQIATAEEPENIRTAISGELGLILLGTALLSYGAYVFVLRLCKSLASNANE
ncbi:hypothetical protein VDG1235_474 [Verrucomicrobiia bacterium DG1235]|nr:hypothetical protein VDG1235_474 [Verrucomicrobiae bacterium DG1235]